MKRTRRKYTKEQKQNVVNGAAGLTGAELKEFLKANKVSDQSYRQWKKIFTPKADTPKPLAEKVIADMIQELKLEVALNNMKNEWMIALIKKYEERHGK